MIANLGVAVKSTGGKIGPAPRQEAMALAQDVGAGLCRRCRSVRPVTRMATRPRLDSTRGHNHAYGYWRRPPGPGPWMGAGGAVRLGGEDREGRGWRRTSCFTCRRRMWYALA
jgi:hypothetical protein